VYVYLSYDTLFHDLQIADLKFKSSLAVYEHVTIFCMVHYIAGKFHQLDNRNLCLCNYYHAIYILIYTCLHSFVLR